MGRLLLSDIIQPSVEGDFKFFARSAGAGDFEGLMDPLLAINHFETTGNVTSKYASTGISEIFYVFEDSAPYQATDTKGITTTVAPGSVLWVTPGEDKKHSEGPVQTGNRVEGVQLFLNSSGNNDSAPTFSIDKSQMPLVDGEGIRVKVLCGKTGPIESKVETPQDLTVLHIALETGKEFRHILPANWSGTLFALEGRFDVMAAEETFELEEGMVISMGYSGHTESLLFTGLTSAKLLFVSGHPMKKEQPQEDLFERAPRFVPVGTHVGRDKV